MVPTFRGVVKFFTEVLDFSLTEAAEGPDGVVAAFLSCSNKAHDIAFTTRPEPGKFHHAAFWLDPWHEVGQPADFTALRSISGRPATALRAARPSISSTRPATATKCFPAALFTTSTIRCGFGRWTKSARPSFTISVN